MTAREMHGVKGTPEYRAWCDMKARCTNRSHPQWRNYGGRGIAVCYRWTISFSSFLADMGSRPAGLSLDRFPDNDGNYEPGNCRWASARQQVLNQRVRRDNTTGLRGVHWNAKRGIYQVHLCARGRNRTVGARVDFFEACCLRKSAERHQEDLV